MAKQSAKKILGMDKSVTKKPRGRTTANKPQDPAPTHRHKQVELLTQANRPVGPGAGIHRGDRRDTHPRFSTGIDKRAGGKRGPIGASTRKGGTND